MSDNLVQSKSNSKLKNMDAFHSDLYDHISRLNLFQTIDQSLIFNSASASSLPQSKLLAESSSSLDEDFNDDEVNSDDSDSNLDANERDPDDAEYGVDDDDYESKPIKQGMRANKRNHHHHHHHHHHQHQHSVDESDLCDQEIINIFNIDNRSCLVSINSHQYSLCCAKTPRSHRKTTNRNATTTTTTTNNYVMRPSLDFEKMIKVIIKDLSSV